MGAKWGIEIAGTMTESIVQASSLAEAMAPAMNAAGVRKRIAIKIPRMI
jgi:hypothetical protein